jgi:hypothetical protein
VKLVRFYEVIFSNSARTTQLILKGKTPALVAPALQNGRVKQDILRTVKKEHFQHGSDIPGIFFPFKLNPFNLTF